MNAVILTNRSVFGEVHVYYSNEFNCNRAMFIFLPSFKHENPLTFLYFLHLHTYKTKISIEYHAIILMFTFHTSIEEFIYV